METLGYLLHQPSTHLMPFTIGLERLLSDPTPAIEGRRLGLVMNQASVDRRFRYACDLIDAAFPGQLKSLFSPQHGLWTEEQANMIESGHQVYAALGLPIHSLYSETRRPTMQMLDGIDVLLIDLQDVGTRVYTFTWTMLECLRACAEVEIPVVILDRPNPVGGVAFEGPLLDPAYLSFVGNVSIPLRHGLTMGELALLFNTEEQIGADLHVMTMQGWRREMLFAETGLHWVAPSPNMPRVETTLLYPGQVLLEGTNLSEGRGTTLPFEVVGAPWLDERNYLNAIESLDFPGVLLRPIRFRPTFDKWRGEICRGVSIHCTDPAAIRSVDLTVALIAEAHTQARNHFAWLPPPYEYEYVKPPIDILFGSDRLRNRIAVGDGMTRDEIAALTRFDEVQWRARVAPLLLY